MHNILNSLAAKVLSKVWYKSIDKLEDSLWFEVRSKTWAKIESHEWDKMKV